MPQGCYFHIQNSLTGTVLQVKRGKDSQEPQPISTGCLVPMIQENDHQLWFYDKDTQTIRSKVNGFCLDVQMSNGLQQVFISPYQLNKGSQLWVMTEDQIQMETDFEMVICLDRKQAVEVEEGSTRVAADELSNVTRNSKVIVSEYNNDESQKWKIAHVQTEFFYVISQADDKVIDVKARNPKAGAEVILCKRLPKYNDNQLWYQDVNGVIRSKLNNFALTAASDTVTLQPYTENNDRQKWTICGSRIKSQADDDMVLEAKAGYLSTYMSEAIYCAASKQHWFFDYPVDQAIGLSHSGAGKFVFLRCRLNGAVVTAAGQGKGPGIYPVILAGQKSSTENCDDQLWFVDPTSGVVWSALNGFCLDINENRKIIINTYDPSSESQQWTLKADLLHSNHNPNCVLETSVTEDGLCQITLAQHKEGNESQIWDIEHSPAKCMYICNGARDLVLTVKEDDWSSGAVIMMPKQKIVNLRQLWYEDENGIIRSKLNGYTIDTQESGVAKIRPHYPENKKQMWTMVGDTLQNKHEPKKVLDIKAGKKGTGTPVIELEFHGGDNQRWQLDYLDG